MTMFDCLHHGMILKADSETVIPRNFNKNKHAKVQIVTRYLLNLVENKSLPVELRHYVLGVVFRTITVDWLKHHDKFLRDY